MDYKHLSNGISDTSVLTNVKIRDMKMPPTSHSHRAHRIWSICCTRRNRLLTFGLLIFVFAFWIFASSGIFSRTNSYTSFSEQDCKLDDIELQSDFDFEKFAGDWYGAYTKGMENKLLAYFLEFYDVKTKFILKKDGNYDLRSVGGKFLGMWCPIGEGHADVKDSDSPQKLDLYFDTPTGKKFGRKPGWVLKTDYTSYGIIYSCWDKTKVGACKGTSLYIVVLTRSAEKLPEEKKQEIDQALLDICVNPEVLKPIKHVGYCKKERQTL